MPRFSKRSQERLKTCHKDIQAICNDAIEIIDFSVIWGRRNEEEQTKAYNEGYSKAKYGESKHNVEPKSEAVDLLPYPSGWGDKEQFYLLAGVIKACAHKRKIKIKWGGEFKSFFDGAHFEIIRG